MSAKKRITRKDYFELLPEDVREEAIEAIRKHSHLTVEAAMAEHCDGSGSGSPLTSVFYWSATEQGHDYWEEVNFNYFTE
jgi:hypothetical protein